MNWHKFVLRNGDIEALMTKYLPVITNLVSTINLIVSQVKFLFFNEILLLFFFLRFDIFYDDLLLYLFIIGLNGCKRSSIIKRD